MSIGELPRVRKPRKVRFDKFGDPILPRGAEFVDGVILRKHGHHAASEVSNWVGYRISKAVESFVTERSLGIVFTGAGDQGFRCFTRKPSQVRKPDVSFVRRDLHTFFLREEGYTPDVPELVVEVVSPNDKFDDLAERVLDFRFAGTRLIWIIDPKHRSAKVIHPDGVEWPIPDTGFLDGEDVLPGLRIPLASVLPPPKA